jgi:hypothetical protein
MFIPKGKPIHQNLATSYVLVEALVADLCEGGFSGVVEIMLRGTDNHIVFDRGRIAGVIEKRGDTYSTKTSVAELAAKSRTERGRVAIFSYAVPVAKALAGRLFAETLYTKLSTEFADLEKLVGKFMREPERQWFIEVLAEHTLSMIFIDNGRCSVIQSESLSNESDLEIAGLNNNLALRQLVERCANTGGVFDVHFKTIEDEASVETQAAEAQGIPDAVVTTGRAAGLPLEPPSHFEAPIDASVAALNTAMPLGQGVAREAELPVTFSDREASPNQSLAPHTEATPDASFGFEIVAAKASAKAKNGGAEDSAFSTFLSAAELEEGKKLPSNQARPQATPKASGTHQREIRILPTRELMALAGDTEQTAEDLKLAEIKKLMGEIANAIEDVLRIVEHRDDFSMHLRAGQLKLANQYAFLDPFGAEFEYMEGEIVFVGQTSADEFINGVTDALRLAFLSAIQASANPTRLRSFVIDKLRFIFNRSRQDYVGYGLDASLEQIAGVKF